MFGFPLCYLVFLTIHYGTYIYCTIQMMWWIAEFVYKCNKRRHKQQVYVPVPRDITRHIMAFCTPKERVRVAAAINDQLVMYRSKVEQLQLDNVELHQKIYFMATHIKHLQDNNGMIRENYDVLVHHIHMLTYHELLVATADL